MPRARAGRVTGRPCRRGWRLNLPPSSRGTRMAPVPATAPRQSDRRRNRSRRAQRDQELTCNRVDLSVCREGRVDPAEVERANGLELAVDLDRKGHLDERENVSGVGKDVCVGRSPAAPARIQPGFHISVAIPARTAGLEPHSVDHAIPSNEWERRTGSRIGAISQVKPIQCRRQRTGDGEVARRDLVGDRGEVAIRRARITWLRHSPSPPQFPPTLVARDFVADA
jgi:hypothetical protein